MVNILFYIYIYIYICIIYYIPVVQLNDQFVMAPSGLWMCAQTIDLVESCAAHALTFSEVPGNASSRSGEYWSFD